MSAEALKNLRQLLGMFRALEGAEKVLEAIASAEQKKNSIEAEIDRIGKDLIKARADADKWASEHAEAAAKARADMTEIKRRGQADADRIIFSAQEKAKSIVEEADGVLALAKKLKAEADDAVDAAKAECQRLRDEADAHKKRLDEALAAAKAILS